MSEPSPSTHPIADRAARVRPNSGPNDRRLTREPIGFHVTIRLEDDRPIAATQAALRVVARVVLEQGMRVGSWRSAPRMTTFTHPSQRTEPQPARSRGMSRARWCGLGLGARFEHARIRPLHDQKHAYNTFRYVHRQDSRHLLDLDRAREGSSLPDLLGLRVLPTSLVARVRTHLPRIRRRIWSNTSGPMSSQRPRSRSIRVSWLTRQRQRSPFPICAVAHMTCSALVEPPFMRQAQTSQAAA